MTADERLEALLNRAGQTISDLPKKGMMEVSEPYPLNALPKANGAAWNWYLGIGTDMDDYDSTRSKMILKLYILHLTDIIDRMETALENVCGERDYLRHVAGVDGCWTCTNSDSGMECHRPEGCVLNDEGRCAGYEYAGIPEDWRVDDERPADA